MRNYLLVLIMAMSLAACDQNVKPDDENGSAADGSNSGAQVGSVDGEGGDAGQALSVSYEASAINDANSVLAARVVYFDFDSSNVSGDYIELVKHHGKYLSANAGAKIRLEGHTDERGTREYNVALADRRAQSVKRLLMFQGASSDQITIISYGEEKPANLGHDEESWSLNRRAELVYQ
ncbi:MAG: peptidoglycan-associated lipoprotein Pal [Gammaproteobacteria bacterium]|nr:peptidoglycan-associated lipoprotein Pal [Gammaproteobacteria bacterium]